MNKTRFALSLAAALVLGACSSVPKTTGLLEQARSDYRMAQNNPFIDQFAQPQMQQAGVAMDQANVAAGRSASSEEIDKLAYLARQQIALTQELAKQRLAEVEAARSARERDRLRQDQRSSDANQARANAEQAALVQRKAKADAAQAKSEADDARYSAEDAQRRIDAARRMTEEAQARTQEAQREALQAQVRNSLLETQLLELAARKTERGMVITLGDVLFGSDLARLNPQGLRTAQKLAQVLEQHPQRTVLVEGFADSTGGAAHNQELSERRAAAVRVALQEMGIAQSRIAVRGYGEAYPVAANDSLANRQLNRRVEIVLSDASGLTKPR